jgi:hypothetical protein
MNFQISALLALALRRTKIAYHWVTARFVRLAIMVFVLGFGSTIASIIVGNLGGNVFWKFGVWGLGWALTLHFAMKTRKFISPDK